MLSKVIRRERLLNVNSNLTLFIRFNLCSVGGSVIVQTSSACRESAAYSAAE